MGPTPKGWMGVWPAPSHLPPRRLLVVRGDRLGDCVITTSCLKPLAAALPHTQITVAVASAHAPLVAGTHAVDQVIPIVDHDILKWTRRLTDGDYDAAVFLNPHPVIEAACAHCHVPVRIGTSREKGRNLTLWRPYSWKKKGLQHEAAYNFDLLAPLGITRPGTFLPDSFEWATEPQPPLPPRAVLLHLASFGDKPTVPPEFFAALATRLIEDRKAAPCLIGHDPEDPAIPGFYQALPAAYRPLVQNRVGATDVVELAGLCRRASLMISRDSGPAHLAAATGCPTLTLFLSQRPPMSPRRWHPLGPRSMIYSEPVIALPFEPPHREAARIAQKLKVTRAVGLINSLWPED